MGAILSFLSGSAFRLLWGEFSSWLNKRQDHKHELERMSVQERLDAAQHARNIESIKVQADLQVKVIRQQADADIQREEVRGWADAVAQAMKPTGIKWIDAWNGSIRPAFGTAALVLWLLSEYRTGWALAAWSLDLMAVVIGFFFASRELTKRGK